MTAIELLVCCLLPLGLHGQEYLLQMEPQNPLLPGGGTLTVNCSTNCPDPELINLETSLSKEPIGEGVGWAAFQLINVTVDSQLLCSGYCSGVQITTTSSITVYKLPERVELAPFPLWYPVGRNFTLHCQVIGGEPRTQLSVVLLRGEEELVRKPVLGNAGVVMATLLADRSDHGANFSCRAELDLRPHGLALFQNTSAPRQLRTFALPMTPPSLVVPPILEVGTLNAVDCTLDGLFPASEAQVQMTLGDRMLNTTVTSHGDSLRATAAATAHADQEGVKEIVCIVSLGGHNFQAQENLTIFSFLGPIVSLSETNITEGSKVNVTCTSGANTQVLLDGAPVPPPGKPAELQLHARESDDGREFFCKATLEVEGIILYRNATVQLHVFYGPKIDRAKCPQRFAWKDRTTHILQCQARGNPVPHLQCLQDSSRREVPIGIPFLVNLSHNGTYQCQASSPRGTHTLLVVIDVQGRNLIWINIFIGVLVILGVVTTAVALLYIFWLQKRKATYHLKHPSTSVPLRALQSENTAGKEAL
uniref:intercellular adhesion molecule 3 n=1 Tax=Jaculus jaculus TaxID=51337 RepID=UPI001E1AF966|nr:intercellular adhesion molecule 3 [Jaculus jaculus]